MNSPWRAGWEESGMSIDHIRGLGRRGIEEYHRWAIGARSVDPNRIRMVSYLSVQPKQPTSSLPTPRS
jgi:hypothetical protein